MDLSSPQFGDLLESIAAKSPAPGGGTVAGMIAAVGSALLEMVVQYTRGSRKYAEHATLHDEAVDLLRDLRTRALRLAGEDVAAYERLDTLRRLDANDPARNAEWPGAVEAVIAIPLQSMSLAEELLACCDSMLGRSNRLLASDLAIAAIAAEAALRAAAWNVRINLPLLEDADRREALAGEIDRRIEAARACVLSVEDGCR